MNNENLQLMSTYVDTPQKTLRPWTCSFGTSKMNEASYDSAGKVPQSNLDRDDDIMDFHQIMMTEAAKLDDAIKIQDSVQFTQVQLIIEDEEQTQAPHFSKTTLSPRRPSQRSLSSRSPADDSGKVPRQKLEVAPQKSNLSQASEEIQVKNPAADPSNGTQPPENEAQLEDKANELRLPHSPAAGTPKAPEHDKKEESKQKPMNQMGTPSDGAQHQMLKNPSVFSQRPPETAMQQQINEEFNMQASTITFGPLHDSRN